MDLSLTYEKLLDFPEDFMKKSVKYSVIADPISSEECKKYDTKDLHDKVSFRIRKFKDAKYIYQFPDLKYNIPMTPNYQLREVIMPRNLESSQSKIITKETDKEIWVTKLYYCLINVVSTKLTKQETVYFIESFFKKESEESISEKLLMCRKTLQKVKKSCLIKVWVEMEALSEYEDFK